MDGGAMIALNNPARAHLLSTVSRKVIGQCLYGAQSRVVMSKGKRSLYVDGDKIAEGDRIKVGGQEGEFIVTGVNPNTISLERV
jgi:hypothetical protein